MGFSAGFDFRTGFGLVQCINRSMGQPDMYPFALSPRAIEKLGFVHHVISGAAQPSTTHDRF
jgi:hypothetical protein